MKIQDPDLTLLTDNYMDKARKAKRHSDSYNNRDVIMHACMRERERERE